MKLLTTSIALGLVPEALVRIGIRQLLAQRLRQERTALAAQGTDHVQKLIRALDESPVALCPEKANQQHYEIPARFFQYLLGPHLKYSGCLWGTGVESLAEAEAASLELCCQRAGLQDGQEILELGCGWGSLTLWMAERYPHSRILAMSNSTGQRAFILERCRERQLSNVEVHTADVNGFEPDRTFDRIVSVELLEHVRNYRRLFSRIAGWLNPGGQFFVHIFCHRQLAYPFEAAGATDWMGRHFFTGGLMPSADLFSHFQHHLSIRQQWWLDGTHYSRTAGAWLLNLERHRQAVDQLLVGVYGADHRVWLGRWKLFFMACQELFGYDNGQQWGVAHYLFGKS